ncbi:MAG: dihydropteroate synthase [Pricia sp.]
MTLNCKGHLVDLTVPKVMGVLNLTPDSFYDGGKYKEEKSAISHTGKMLGEGATFIDVGAYSSRPGADAVSEGEELRRILPVVELLLEKFPDILLSIDTFRSTVADRCLKAGASIINDISAGMLDGNMLATVARHRVPYIMMHLRGTPQTMHQLTDYDNLIIDILRYFSERIAEARTLGMMDIIVDPGFGFAKTLEQNYRLLSELDLFQNMGLPVLAGLSRKSMIYKVLETDPENALNGTTALNMVALINGANILRVHDVNEAVECIRLFEAVMENKSD